MTIKVEFYKDLSRPPHRKLYLKRNQIPAINRGAFRKLKGINCIRIHGPNIIQVAGYNWNDGLYCYLTQPDGTLVRSF